MANWTILKEAIANVIKTNGNQEITGQVLQNTLTNIVNAVGENATFVDVATPSTNPGTPDGPVFYLAAGPGVFSNFGITLSISECAVFLWNGVSWIKKTISFSTLEAFKHITSTGVYNLHGYISTSGNFAASDDYRATDFIPLIKKYSNIILENVSARNSSLIIAFYDENKAFISGINNATSANISVEDIPENAKYIRCGTSLATAEIAVMYINNMIALSQSIAENSQSIAENSQSIAENSQSIATLKVLPSNGVYNLHGYISISGNFAASDNYRATDFIPLSTNAPILINHAYAGNSSLIIAFYDENKAFISGINNATSANISVEDIPENAKYIRCGTSLATAETAIIINTSIAELGTRVAELGTRVAELGTRVAEIRNLSPTLDLVGYYGLHGALNPTSNAKNTGFIPIAGYAKLEYQVNISKAGAAVSFWNKDREYIPSLSIPGAGLTSGTIDLTQSKYDDAEYIVISYYDATGSYSQYKGILSNENSLESRVAELESKEFTSVLLPSKDDKLSILIFGDSITDCASITIDSITNTTTAYSLRHPANSYTDSEGQLIRFDIWPYLITQYLNCFDLRNYAKSGASYKYSERKTEDLKRQNLSYQIEVAINDINNPNGVFPTEGQFSPDIIIFALGTNDGSPNDTFDSAMAKTIMDEAGTSFDIEATLSNLDLSKFCEAARYAFLTIKKQFPYALCMCVLPIQRASSDIQQAGVNSELKKMAERYSIKVIDGASEMGIVRDLETSGGLGTSLKDGLHPNEKGQNLYARLVINAIKNNWLKLSLMNEM